MANPNPIRKWQPGQSGNPTGRPREPLSQLVRERMDNGRELADILVSIARGEPQLIPTTVRMSDGTHAEIEAHDKAGNSITVLVPDLSDRRKAVAVLTDHVFGKAPERVPVDQHGNDVQITVLPGVEPFMLRALADVQEAAQNETDAEIIEDGQTGHAIRGLDPRAEVGRVLPATEDAGDNAPDDKGGLA